VRSRTGKCEEPSEVGDDGTSWGSRASHDPRAAYDGPIPDPGILSKDTVGLRVRRQSSSCSQPSQPRFLPAPFPPPPTQRGTGWQSEGEIAKEDKEERGHMISLGGRLGEARRG
jgi:hypothetical protein